MTKETASKLCPDSSEGETSAPSDLFTRLLAVKEIVESTSEDDGDLNQMDGLPRIWKANFLRLKLSEEKQKEGY